MKIYRLVFADLETGKVVQWKSNKPEVRKFVNEQKRLFPMRQLVLQERLDVPTKDKPALIDWLNEHANK